MSGNVRKVTIVRWSSDLIGGSHRMFTHFSFDALYSLTDGSSTCLAKQILLLPHRKHECGTVIHRLMIHHQPIIHFRNVNNFLKNTYFLMNENFFNTCIYSPPTVKIWWGLNKLQAQCIAIKSWYFADLAEMCPTTQWYTNILRISQRQLIQIFWNLETIK